jgi:hypothetical protein
MFEAGHQKIGGRKKGTPNKANALAVLPSLAQLVGEGITPLEYLLSVMRDEGAPRELRIDAAAKACPYIHPKLASVEQRIGNADGTPIAQPVIQIEFVRSERRDAPPGEVIESRPMRG